MSAWVSSRPGSLYDQKKEPTKESKKEQRPHSVSLVPRKDLDTTTSLSSSRFTSPAFPAPNSIFDASSPPQSPRSAASLDDLDDLIDIFDDLTDEPNGEDFSEERLLEEYAATLEHEDISTEESRRRSEAGLSTSPPYPHSASASPSPSLPSYSSSPRDPSSPEYLLDTSNSHEEDEDDSRKMPGLRGSAKRDPNPAANQSTNFVRVAAATSILDDALEGIETGTVDMALMKHYITSALCILRTLS